MLHELVEDDPFATLQFPKRRKIETKAVEAQTCGFEGFAYSKTQRIRAKIDDAHQTDTFKADTFKVEIP